VEPTHPSSVVCCCCFCCSPNAAAAVAAAAGGAAAAAMPLQAVDEFISRMCYVPTASANEVIKVFWDTIIKYHMLSK
jgi:hypothetical protein